MKVILILHLPRIEAYHAFDETTFSFKSQGNLNHKKFLFKYARAVFH